MDMKHITGGTLTALVLAGGIAGMVSAQTVADATGLTEDQIIAIALTEVPGDVQDIELEQHDGMQIYEIDIRDATGAEIEVEIAAQTGDILSVRAEDEDSDDDDQDDDGEEDDDDDTDKT